MKTIWKFPISPNAQLYNTFEIRLKVPAGAVPLCINLQHHRPCLWMEVDPEAPEEKFVMYCVGTGFGAFPENARYFCSLIEGDYVWHFYIPNEGGYKT